MRPAFNEILNYDQDTGVFTWKVNAGRHGRYKAGTIAGGMTGKGYWQIGIGNKIYEAHRIAWFMITGKWPEFMIDHHDRNRINNRFDNLRNAARSQNASNSKLRSDNKVRLKGVYMRGNKYRAQIRKNGKLISLGTFSNPIDASLAYQNAAYELHGEFARMS